MELLKNLELVQVVYENEGKKAIMTFLYEEAGEIACLELKRNLLMILKKLRK